MNFPSKEFDPRILTNNSFTSEALDQSLISDPSLATTPYVDTGIKVDDASLQILMGQESIFADMSGSLNQSIPAKELESILEDLKSVEKEEKEKEKTDDSEISKDEDLKFTESNLFDLPGEIGITSLQETLGQIDPELSLLVKLYEFEKAYFHVQTLKKQGSENYTASFNFFLEGVNKLQAHAKKLYYCKNFNEAIASLPSFENLKWDALEPLLYSLILKNYKIKIESLMKLERFEEAQKIVEEKIKQYPALLYLQSYLCIVLYKSCQYEKAIKIAENIISSHSSKIQPDTQTRNCLSHAHLIIGKSKLRLSQNLEEVQNSEFHTHFRAMLEYCPNDPETRCNYIDFTIRTTRDPVAFLERIDLVMLTNCIRTTYEVVRKLILLDRLELLNPFLKKYKEVILNTEHLSTLYKLLRLVLRKPEAKDIFPIDIKTVSIASTPQEIILGLTHCLENKRYSFLLDKALPPFKKSGKEKQNQSLLNALETIESESLLLSGFDKTLSNKFWTNQAYYKKTGMSLCSLDSEIYCTFMLGISNITLAEKCILHNKSKSVIKNIVGAMKRYQMGLIPKEQLPEVNKALQKTILTPIEELAMAYFLRETGQQDKYLDCLNKILINDPTNTHLTILAAKNISPTQPLARAKAWLSGIHRVKNPSQLTLEGLEDLLCLTIDDTIITITKLLILAFSLPSIEENLAGAITKAIKKIEPYGFNMGSSPLPPIKKRNPFEEVPYDKSKYLGILIEMIRGLSSNPLTFAPVLYLLPAESENDPLRDVLKDEHFKYFNSVRKLIETVSNSASIETGNYIIKGSYTEALKLISHYPGDPSFGKTYETILEQKIFLYRTLKNYEEALRLCLHGISKNPLNPVFNLNLAHIYLVKKEFKKSQYQYEFYLRNSDPKTHTHTTYYELALALNNQGKPPSEVADTLIKAIEKSPGIAFQAYALLFNTILDKLEGSPKELMEKLPKCFLTSFHAASYHYKKRNFRDAYLECAKAWPECRPGTVNPDLLSTLVWTYLRSSLEVNVYSQTVSHWNEQNKKDPNSLKSILFELQLANIKEDPLQILSTIARFMSLFSKTSFFTKEMQSTLNYLYAKGCFFMGRLNDAEKHLLTTKKHVVAPLKAIIFLMKKNFEAAKNELQKVPDETFLHLLCGFFEDSQSKVLSEDCFDRLEKAFLEQRHLEYHIIYAYFLLEVNELPRVFNFLKTSVKITKPTSSSFLYLIFTDAYLKKSDIKSALFCVSQGLEHSPDKKLLFLKMAAVLKENLSLLDDVTFWFYFNKLSNFKEKGLPLETFSANQVQQTLTELRQKHIEHTHPVTLNSQNLVAPMPTPITPIFSPQISPSSQALTSPRVIPSPLQQISPSFQVPFGSMLFPQITPSPLQQASPSAQVPFKSMLTPQITPFNLQLTLPLSETPKPPSVGSQATPIIIPSGELHNSNDEVEKIGERLSILKQKLEDNNRLLSAQFGIAYPAAQRKILPIPTLNPILNKTPLELAPSQEVISNQASKETRAINPDIPEVLQPRRRVSKQAQGEKKPIIQGGNTTRKPKTHATAAVKKGLKPITPSGGSILQPGMLAKKEAMPIIPKGAPILETQNASSLLVKNKPLTPNRLLTHPTKRAPEEKTSLSQHERPSKKRAVPSLDTFPIEIQKGENDPKEDRVPNIAAFQPKPQEATILGEDVLEGGTFIPIQKVESPKHEIQEAAKLSFKDLNSKASGNQISSSISLFPNKRKSPPRPQNQAGIKKGKPPKRLKVQPESEVPTPPQVKDHLRSPTPPKMEMQTSINLENGETIEKLTPPQAIDQKEAATPPKIFNDERLKQLSEGIEKRISLLSPAIQWTYGEVKDLSSDEIFGRWEPFDSQKKVVDYAYGSAFESWEPSDIRSASGLLFDSSNELELLKEEIFSKVAAVVSLKGKRHAMKVSFENETANLEKVLHESEEREIQGGGKIDLVSLKEKLSSMKFSFENEMASLEKGILEGERECALLRESLLKKSILFLSESTADFKSDIYYSARGPNFLLNKKPAYLNSFNDFLICLKDQKKWALKSNQEKTILPLLKELQREAKSCLIDFYKELPRYLAGHGIIKHGSREFYKLLYKVLKKSIIFDEKEKENNNFQILKELQKLLEIVETLKCFDEKNVTKMKLLIQEQLKKCYED